MSDAESQSSAPRILLSLALKTTLPEISSD